MVYTFPVPPGDNGIVAGSPGTKNSGITNEFNKDVEDERANVTISLSLQGHCGDA